MSQNNSLTNCRRTDAVIEALAAHPYFAAFCACILIHPFYLGAVDNIPNNAMLLEFLIVLIAAGLILHRCYKQKKIDKYTTAILGAAIILADVYGAKKYSVSENKGLWMLLGGTAILIIIYYIADTKKYKQQLNTFLIIGAGFLMKFYYVLCTSVYTRQNDVHLFGGDAGHAAYIEYLLYNHKLPDFDVRNVWQFCHPPLHHIISAFWIDLNENIFGIGHNQARESLQTLTLFYSVAIIITAYRILRHFKINGAALYIPLTLISFHPAFILLSGSINNDVLSVLFMMLAVNQTLKWYDEQRIGTILKIAIFVGLGMMTKLSAAIVAPAIALVFLIVFIKKFRTDGLRLFGQFAAFAAVCVPTALWFEIKNYIKFKVPITYVQEMPNTVRQYIGDKSYKERLTDFSSKQFDSVFECWLSYDDSGKAIGYNEYNPIIAMFKNSLFGESINENSFNGDLTMIKTTKLFFWLGIIIAILFLTVMIIMLFKKSMMKPTHKAFLGVFYASLIFNYLKMCSDYPFTCTQNFRYITPTVIITSIFCGVFLQTVKDNANTKNKEKAVVSLTYIIALLVGLFTVLSIQTYTVVCMQ